MAVGRLGSFRRGESRVDWVRFVAADQVGFDLDASRQAERVFLFVVSGI